MLITPMSDLHLEFGDIDFDLGQGNVLVLAGDIHVAAYLHAKNPEILEADMLGRYVRLVDRGLENYDHVVAIAGNHESYHGVLQYTPHIIRKYITNDRFKFLEKESVVIDGVQFFGATLWTDMNQGDSRTIHECGRGIRDYHLIDYYERAEDVPMHRPLTPMDTITDHNATIGILEPLLAEATVPTVVVSHHAPSKKSTHPRYSRENLVNGAYSTNLEYLMGPHVPLWVHGHTHDSWNYEVNGTRVICNPRGYVGHHLNRHFNPKLSIEV